MHNLLCLFEPKFPIHLLAMVKLLTPDSFASCTIDAFPSAFCFDNSTPQSHKSPVLASYQNPKIFLNISKETQKWLVHFLHLQSSLFKSDFGWIKSTNNAWSEKSTQHGIYCVRNVKQKIYTLTLATKSQMV
uniref:Uncharacterized protein n=1 Tax=Glossina austeni TaxID=7395 RepID=A0A1A9VW57_GLOAU